MNLVSPAVFTVTFVLKIILCVAVFVGVPVMVCIKTGCCDAVINALAEDERRRKNQLQAYAHTHQQTYVVPTPRRLRYRYREVTWEY